MYTCICTYLCFRRSTNMKTFLESWCIDIFNNFYTRYTVPYYATITHHEFHKIKDENIYVYCVICMLHWSQVIKWKKLRTCFNVTEKRVYYKKKKSEAQKQLWLRWSFVLSTVGLLGNYRPISLLPAISKLFERILFNHIHVFLVCQLDKLLSWFSTQTSVVNFRYYLFCLCNVRRQ